MERLSKNEYSFLKNEVTEIKSCITKYNLYIIGITGFSGLSFRYFSTSNLEVDASPNPNYELLLIILSLISITSLFEIIWYKFKSHNRHVGLLQLLSQETEHFSTIKKTSKIYSKKKYLDRPRELKRSKKKDLYSWEFVMNRLSNVRRGKNKLYLEALLKSTRKADFRFDLPADLSYCMLNDFDLDYSDLDSEFFRSIISPQFNKEIRRRHLLTHIVLNIASLFSKNWSKRSSLSILRKNNGKLDLKYISNGWQFPVVILRLCLLQIIILVVAGLYLLYSRYSMFQLSSFDYQENQSFLKSTFNGLKSFFYSSEQYGMIFLVLVISLIGVWLFRYVRHIDELMVGRESIDNYCWSFFVFRVQLLNSVGILPSYFSRGFIRFFKSKLTLAYSKTLIPINENGRCSVCSDGQSTLHGYFSVKDNKQLGICSKCFKRYQDHLDLNTRFEDDSQAIQVKSFFFKERVVRSSMRDFHDYLQTQLKKYKDKYQCSC